MLARFAGANEGPHMASSHGLIAKKRAPKVNKFQKSKTYKIGEAVLAQKLQSGGAGPRSGPKKSKILKVKNCR